MKLVLLIGMAPFAALALPDDAPVKVEQVVFVDGQALVGRAPAFPATRDDCYLWEKRAQDWKATGIVMGGLSAAGGAISAILAAAFGKKWGGVAAGGATVLLGIGSAVSLYNVDSYSERYMQRCTVEVSQH